MVPAAAAAVAVRIRTPSAQPLKRIDRKRRIRLRHDTGHCDSVDDDQSRSLWRKAITTETRSEITKRKTIGRFINNTRMRDVFLFSLVVDDKGGVGDIRDDIRVPNLTQSNKYNIINTQPIGCLLVVIKSVDLRVYNAYITYTERLPPYSDR